MRFIIRDISKKAYTINIDGTLPIYQLFYYICDSKYGLTLNAIFYLKLYGKFNKGIVMLRFEDYILDKIEDLLITDNTYKLIISPHTVTLSSTTNNVDYNVIHSVDTNFNKKTRILEFILTIDIKLDPVMFEIILYMIDDMCKLHIQDADCYVSLLDNTVIVYCDTFYCSKNKHLLAIYYNNVNNELNKSNNIYLLKELLFDTEALNVLPCYEEYDLHSSIIYPTDTEALNVLPCYEEYDLHSSIIYPTDDLIEINKIIDTTKCITPTIDSQLLNNNIKEGICISCKKNIKNTLFMPCKHICVCNICSIDYDICSICNATISDKIKVYI